MSLKKQYIHGAFWLFSEKVLSFLVGFIGGIILARLLEPADFGAVAMATGTFLILARFSAVGIGPEIMRLDDQDAKFNLWLSTFFWINASLVCSILMLALSLSYGVNFLSDEARKVFWVIALGWSINNFLSPARSLMLKNKRFSKIAFFSKTQQLLGMLGAIILAYLGAGIWALVIPQIVMLTLISLIIFLIEGKEIKFLFSKEAFKFIRDRSLWHISYGVSEEGFQKGDDLVIGAFLLDQFLGFYVRAYNLVSMLPYQLSGLLHNLSTPIYADPNSELLTITRMLELCSKFIIYICFSLTLFMVIFIEDIILFLYGEKWLTSAKYFYYIAPSAIMWPLYTHWKNFLVAQGNIQFVSKVDLLKLIIMLLGALGSVSVWGVVGVALSVNLSIAIAVILVGKKLFRNHTELFKNLVKPFSYIFCSLLCYGFLGEQSSMYLIIFSLFFIWLERKDIYSIVKY